MKKNLNQEAANYLKTHPEYHQVLELIRKKYVKSGILSGRIQLENLSEKEAIELGSIDQNLFSLKSGSLSVKKFIKHISSGKFEEIDFIQVLSLYFGKELVSRKTIRANKQEEKELYFNDQFNSLKGDLTKKWFSQVLSTKKFGYTLLLKNYTMSPKILKKDIKFLDHALQYIELNPLGAIPLPAFSSLITKNSHYFDLGSKGGKLLINALCFLSEIPLVTSAEEISALLLSFGILRDEISNQVMTYGLLVHDENSVENPGYAWFRDQGEPLALTAYNLKSLHNVQGTKGKVFVFENPAVFYHLLIRYKKYDIKPTLICTSGQPALSVLTLLDIMVRNGTLIYYSGDFDPEGLQMADSLKRRYKTRLEFLEMSVSNYYKIKSEISIVSRINKLDRILSEELLPLVQELRSHKTAGYQELLMEDYSARIDEELSF